MIDFQIFLALNERWDFEYFDDQLYLPLRKKLGLLKIDKIKLLFLDPQKIPLRKIPENRFREINHHCRNAITIRERGAPGSDGGTASPQHSAASLLPIAHERLRAIPDSMPMPRALNARQPHPYLPSRAL